MDLPINQILHGDCRDILKTLPENSIDSIITDPPYGLGFQGAEWDTFDKSQFGIAGNEGEKDLKVIKNFEVMPRYNTDGLQDFTKDWATEVLRVAKPGAIMLCFAGSRTFHRIACGIEDAGWEIKDCMMWIHGQGFPKSTNISKRIDLEAGAKREVVGHLRAGKTALGQGSGWNDHKNTTEPEITVPATDEAKLWDGWQTALKPAYEPILVCQKHIEGTYAKNALKWEVAGLNVDECRIELNGDYKSKPNGRPSLTGLGDNYDPEKANKPDNKGRWPSNVIFDEESAALLDEQTGTLKSGSNCVRTKDANFIKNKGLGKAGDVQTTYGDSGGASRFFYCAKASKSEKGKDNPHPTVKPIAVLKYLATLTKTPTGGIVLDPFVGSGTTAVACKAIGREFIGIELDDNYFEYATKRVQNYIPEPETKVKKQKKKTIISDEDDIFAEENEEK